MIDWKAVAHHQRHVRRLAEQQEIRLKVRLGQEHEKRVALVSAMSDLLPRVALTEDGRCRWCGYMLERYGHLIGCPYIAALAAVAEGGRSVE